MKEKRAITTSESKSLKLLLCDVSHKIKSIMVV